MVAPTAQIALVASTRHAERPARTPVSPRPSGSPRCVRLHDGAVLPFSSAARLRSMSEVQKLGHEVVGGSGSACARASRRWRSSVASCSGGAHRSVRARSGTTCAGARYLLGA